MLRRVARSGRGGIAVASGLAVGLLAVGVLAACGGESDASRVASTGQAADEAGEGVHASVEVVDEDSIVLTLGNSGPSARFGAWAHFTAAMTSDHPRYFQLRVVSPPAWDEVPALDSILQQLGGVLETDSSYDIPVELPPDIGAGPHLLRVGWELEADDQPGAVDVTFETGA